MLITILSKISWKINQNELNANGMDYFLEFLFMFRYAWFLAHCLMFPLFLERNNADFESTSRRTNGENPETNILKITIKIRK